MTRTKRASDSTALELRDCETGRLLDVSEAKGEYVLVDDDHSSGRMISFSQDGEEYVRVGKNRFRRLGPLERQRVRTRSAIRFHMYTVRNLLMMTSRAVSEANVSGSKNPPTWGFYFLALTCDAKSVRAVEGDILESFQKIEAESGRNRANWFYFWQIVRSVLLFGVDLLGRFFDVKKQLGQ